LLVELRHQAIHLVGEGLVVSDFFLRTNVPAGRENEAVLLNVSFAEKQNPAMSSTCPWSNPRANGGRYQQFSRRLLRGEGVGRLNRGLRGNPTNNQDRLNSRHWPPFALKRSKTTPGMTAWVDQLAAFFCAPDLIGRLRAVRERYLSAEEIEKVEAFDRDPL
jgi:hypothetical protein